MNGMHCIPTKGSLSSFCKKAMYRMLKKVDLSQSNWIPTWTVAPTSLIILSNFLTCIVLLLLFQPCRDTSGNTVLKVTVSLNKLIYVKHSFHFLAHSKYWLNHYALVIIIYWSVSTIREGALSLLTAVFSAARCNWKLIGIRWIFVARVGHWMQWHSRL